MKSGEPSDGETGFRAKHGENEMIRAFFATLILILLLSCRFHSQFNHLMTGASEPVPVHNVNTGLNYTSIQEAIDAAETVDGNTILVDSGLYFEHLVVGKSLAIRGEERDTTTVNGRGSGVVVTVAADNVLLSGFTVRNGSRGIFLDHADNCIVLDNKVTDIVADYDYTIYASYANNCTIEQNVIGPNLCPGILVTNSNGSRVSNNDVRDNKGYGINANASMNGLIAQNVVFNNSMIDGIGLVEGSSHCTIVGNNVSGSGFVGISLGAGSSDNLVYDNNFIDNFKQASVVELNNRWDNGLEGNYWSDYEGFDRDQNGIGDTPYYIDENHADNHPLTGTSHFFKTPLGFDVNVISNSSIADFAYFESNGTIRMRALKRTETQDYGFCRVRIPHALMTEPYHVTVDGASPFYWNYTLHEDGGNRWIYFAYQHSDHEVLIKGTPPPDRTPPIVSILSPENKTYNVAGIPLTFIVNEPITWLSYSLDGQDNVTTNGNTTISVGSGDSHHIAVYARDNAGNTGASATVYFTTSTGPESLAFWVASAIVAIAVIAVIVLIYFKKMRKKSGQNKSLNPTMHVNQRVFGCRLEQESAL